jgi:hypothetical protein
MQEFFDHAEAYEGSMDGPLSADLPEAEVAIGECFPDEEGSESLETRLSEVALPTRTAEALAEIAIEIAHNPVNPVAFIRECVEKYPEMTILTTGAELATPGQDAAIEGASIGQELFPDVPVADLREFDRTACGLIAMEWVRSGDYEAFTACQQDNPDRLTRESFDAMRAYTERILPNDQAVEAVRVSLVINDLGKVDSMQRQAEEATGVRQADHDQVLLTALQEFPEVSPSFQSLSSHYQEVVLEGLQAQFSLGQFMQGENVPASLEGVRDVSQEALDIYNLHLLFDIAGAAGHVRQDGSATLTESAWRNFASATTALERVGERPLSETYDDYLTKKAGQLGIGDIADPAKRAAARLGCMLRASTPEQGAAIADVFAALPEETRGILEHELSRTGVDDQATLIYYAPAIMINLERAFAAEAAQGRMAEHEVSARAIFTGCTTLAYLYTQARTHTRHEADNGIFTVMAADVAAVAATHPWRLLDEGVVVARIEGTRQAIARVEPGLRSGTPNLETTQGWLEGPAEELGEV